VVEYSDRHVILAAAVLGMPEERGQGSVDGERDSGLVSERSQAVRVVPVHPEAVAEVDLGRVIAA
jgi:hypothetical protein